MQHRTRRAAILFCGTLLGTAAIAIACDDRGLTDTPKYGDDDDDGGGQTGDGGKSSSSSSGGADDSGTGADCSAAPKLRSNDKGFFCSFLRDGGSTAGPRNCSADETCCNPTKVGTTQPPTYCATTLRAAKGLTDLSSCAAQAAAHASDWSAGGSSWECADKNNCADGKVCCMFTQAGSAEKTNVGPNGNKNIPPACNAKQGFKWGGTYCADACGDTDVALCASTDDNCVAPKKCIPFEIFQGSSSDSRNLGYCN
jgi:hypothetical protein